MDALRIKFELALLQSFFKQSHDASMLQYYLPADSQICTASLIVLSKLEKSVL